MSNNILKDFIAQHKVLTALVAGTIAATVVAGHPGFVVGTLATVGTGLLYMPKYTKPNQSTARLAYRAMAAIFFAGSAITAYDIATTALHPERARNSAPAVSIPLSPKP